MSKASSGFTWPESKELEKQLAVPGSAAGSGRECIVLGGREIQIDFVWLGIFNGRRFNGTTGLTYRDADWQQANQHGSKTCLENHGNTKPEWRLQRTAASNSFSGENAHI